MTTEPGLSGSGCPVVRSLRPVHVCTSPPSHPIVPDAVALCLSIPLRVSCPASTAPRAAAAHQTVLTLPTALHSFKPHLASGSLQGGGGTGNTASLGGSTAGCRKQCGRCGAVPIRVSSQRVDWGGKTGGRGGAARRHHCGKSAPPRCHQMPNGKATAQNGGGWGQAGVLRMGAGTAAGRYKPREFGSGGEACIGRWGG